MDREKLNKAAITYAKKTTTALNPFGRIMDDFKSGADWLMQQPLSERLTEAEIAKAKAAYNKAEEDYDSSNDVAYAVSLIVRTVLIEIFGADLFKEK